MTTPAKAHYAIVGVVYQPLLMLSPAIVGVVAAIVGVVTNNTSIADDNTTHLMIKV